MTREARTAVLQELWKPRRVLVESKLGCVAQVSNQSPTNGAIIIEAS
jgi:hypothetical protein